MQGFGSFDLIQGHSEELYIGAKRAIGKGRSLAAEAAEVRFALVASGPSPTLRASLSLPSCAPS